MTDLNALKHWKRKVDEHGVWWLHLDQQDAAANVLCVPVIEELDALLDDAIKQKPKGIIFLSDKANGFIAGADIKEFTKIENFEHAVNHIRRGQNVLNKIESMPCTTVALIHGFCMGGGAELALACNYRIADDGPKTSIGLPEVQLGIHPGFGGTVRLPPLIGAPNAMDLMLTGKTLDARKAAKMGVIDYAVPTRHFLTAALQVVLEKPKRKQLKGMLKFTNHALVRPILASMMRKQVAQKAPKDHYPAPYAIIKLWKKYMDNPRKMMEEEARSVAKLVTGDTSRNLVKVFFLREQLKNLGKLPEHLKSIGKPKHVHVIGAGVMGGDIAAWCALRGLTVTLQDRHAENLGKAIGRAHKLFSKKMKGDRLGIIAAMDRLIPDIHGHGIPKADVIVEAIVENIEAKQGLYAQLEPKMKPNALLTTNTSSIPLEVLSKTLAKPERLVGLHFFNPVAQMPLIEIVTADNTDADTATRVGAFAAQIGKLPLPVKSAPGFLVNRILMPYMMEAVKLKEEGVSIADIDNAALKFGMPMGPLHLADTVGLDICLHVAQILGKELGLEVPSSLQKMVEAGKLGAKSGEGFYSYSGGKKNEVGAGGANASKLQHITERLIGRMVNEAVACLREGVVENRNHLDAGVIFGTGFAPFRGGPINFAESQGFEKYSSSLDRLASSHGGVFKPDDGWKSLIS
ncbi:MAG: 3-hydroxyacyl-CoA dehydrogenase NAD-binding domain-containing protein [Gammaproteobacteria bacterium]|nr:3-hydroxyacyl-CoA dehydrogenase NAD-binding domain-containing protein [Gammaproteobacteria bacterium]